ncbi:hypothetical protein AD428_02800 [Achromobacter sp. DMS1]|uniref:hypothetical protein n=1 Tax=Achromobacter sp. DMS1 TaxID=1688405 RepID=UPI00069E5A2D|nr:hypothetical protein [Achromobacter sp. DMS1]KOF55125.1 hypothetical protein AD428_02800 [Achromobacter sp. DMS1]
MKNMLNDLKDDVRQFASAWRTCCTAYGHLPTQCVFVGTSLGAGMFLAAFMLLAVAIAARLFDNEQIVEVGLCVSGLFAVVLGLTYGISVTMSHAAAFQERKLRRPRRSV